MLIAHGASKEVRRGADFVSRFERLAVHFENNFTSYVALGFQHGNRDALQFQNSGVEYRFQP